MKVNKITFSKIKTQWELLKMKSAYILAERDIVNDATLTGWQRNDAIEDDSMTLVDFQGWEDGNVRRMSEELKIKKQMEELEEQGRVALDNEDYQKMQILKEVWGILNNKLNK